jgi:hypothetical protein
MGDCCGLKVEPDLCHHLWLKPKVALEKRSPRLVASKSLTLPIIMDKRKPLLKDFSRGLVQHAALMATSTTTGAMSTTTATSTTATNIQPQTGFYFHFPSRPGVGDAK